MAQTGWIVAALLWTCVVAFTAYRIGNNRGYSDGIDDMHQTHLD